LAAVRPPPLPPLLLLPLPLLLWPPCLSPSRSAMHSSLQSFDESRFRSQVSSALSSIRSILDHTRHPTFPADVPVSRGGQQR